MKPPHRLRLLTRLLSASEVLPHPGEPLLHRLVEASRGFNGAQVTAVVRDLELLWFWHERRGNEPVLEALVDEVFPERRSIVRAFGFDTTVSEDTDRICASA